MKAHLPFHFILSFLLTTLLASVSHAGNFGSGPWANDTWYPGNLDGTYEAAVYAPDGTANISGVLGFTISGGTGTKGASGLSTSSGAVHDPNANYFVIFVEGRTYTGVTAANINYDNNMVAGSLLGLNPPANPEIAITEINVPVAQVTVTVSNAGTPVFPVFVTNYVTNTSTIAASTWDMAPMLNRGLSGGFLAKIKQKKGTFTFAGSGELSSASDFITVDGQSVTDSQVIKDADGNPTTIIFSPTSTGRQSIAIRPFELSGIRVAF